MLTDWRHRTSKHTHTHSQLGQQLTRNGVIDSRVVGESPPFTVSLFIISAQFYIYVQFPFSTKKPFRELICLFYIQLLSSRQFQVSFRTKVKNFFFSLPMIKVCSGNNFYFWQMVLCCVCRLIDVTTSRNVSFVFCCLSIWIWVCLMACANIVSYLLPYVGMANQYNSPIYWRHTGATLPMDCIYLLIEI